MRGSVDTDNALLLRLRPQLLLIDQDVYQRTLIEKACVREGIAVVKIESTANVLDTLNDFTPDLILASLAAAPLDAIRLCRTLKENAHYQDIPFWLIFHALDHESIEQALAAGADDVVTRPVSTALLVRRLKKMIIGHHQKHQCDNTLWQLSLVENMAKFGWWSYSDKDRKFACSLGLYQLLMVPPERRSFNDPRQVIAYLPRAFHKEARTQLRHLVTKREPWRMDILFGKKKIPMRILAEYQEITQNFLGYVQLREEIDLAQKNTVPEDNLPPQVLLASNLLKTHLAQYLVLAKQHKRRLAILRINLEGFERMNEELGDQLSLVVTQRFTDCIRKGDIISFSPEETGETTYGEASPYSIAHVGGNDFIIILTNINSVDNIAAVAKRLLDAVSLPLVVHGEKISTSAHMGVSLFPDNGESPTLLLKQTRAALIKAKKQGPGHYYFFGDAPSATMLNRISMELDLHSALERDQFELFYQPIMHAENRRLAGVEALIRWHHPKLGIVTPDRFIGLAEKNGLINDIGSWVIDDGLRQLHEWRSANVQVESLFINISPTQFIHAKFSEHLFSCLKRYHVAIDKIVLEITESNIISYSEKIISLLRYLRNLGVRIAIDDFGTGYSSLGYLKQLPVSMIKIDGGFTENIVIDHDADAIMTMIIHLAQELKLTVVAEGVETRQQADLLREKHCDLLQGYLYSKPMTQQEFAAWYLAHQPSRTSATLRLVRPED